MVSKRSHPDLIVIDQNDSIKIKEIRDLKTKLYLKPFRSRHKVAIINNAHLMTEEGANAFLKILEEPPGDSVIILNMVDKTSLPDTIISRCQILNFGVREKDPEIDNDLKDKIEEALRDKSLVGLFDLAEADSKSVESARNFLEKIENIFHKALLGYEKIVNINERNIVRVVECVEDSYGYLASNVSRRFILENLFIRIITL
jgi:DNA polymerase III delta prime subunit